MILQQLLTISLKSFNSPKIRKLNKYKVSGKKMEYCKHFRFLIIIILSSFILSSCGLYKKTDQRNQPQTAKERAKKNLEDGTGVSINKILKRGRGTGSFEFSSSNPMWRASLETIDFMPLATVDYSGGLIITDWYNDAQNSDEFLKITIRFLSNEVRANSIKIIVHSKKCTTQLNCKITEYKSKISDELTASILRKATILEKELKDRK